MPARTASVSFLAALVAGVACGGGSAGGGGVDPTGTWTITQLWGSGSSSCQPGVIETTFITIAKGSNDFVASVGSNPGSGINAGSIRLGCCVPVTSSFTCDSSGCGWSGSDTFDDAGATVMVTYAMTFDSDASLEGSGTYDAQDEGCAGPFAISGVKH